MSKIRTITRKSFADGIRALYLKQNIKIELVIGKQVWGIGKTGLHGIVSFMYKHGVVSSVLYENSFSVRGSEIRISGSLSEKSGAEICITVDVIYSGEDAGSYTYKNL